MFFRKSFRFRVYPTKEQILRLLAWEHALRFLWNIALEQRLIGLNRARCDRQYVTSFDQINELTELRAELPWLADVPRNVCAQLLVELDNAWQRCFALLSLRPKWKRKGRDKSCLCEPHPKVWKLKSNTILSFPKLGNMRIVAHRELEGKPKTCTITRQADQWFASISCEIEKQTPQTRTTPVVAIDRGCVNLVADSDGKIITNPHFLRVMGLRIARTQRIVARRKKGSHNQEKARLRVAKLHRKVSRQRAHILHQISHDYSKSHGMVVIEKLNVRAMSSEGGAHKKGLNRSILDSGWCQLVSMLRYKLSWLGGFLVEVPAAYSSQTCSVCEVVDARSRLSQADFSCVSCGHREHADVNAAKVLKSRANRSVLPVEGQLPEGSRRSRKRLNVARRSPKSLSL